MKLTCPACGHCGEIKGTEEYFEARGQWPEGHWPVRRCRRCGAGIIVKPGLRRARAQLIDADTWAEMQLLFDEAIRNTAIGPAAETLDAELEQASVDDYFKLMRLACAWAGYDALQFFCNAAEISASTDDAPDLDDPSLRFAGALAEPHVADRALRAATWTVAAREITKRWPDRWAEVLDVARHAMPLDEDAFRRVQHLAGLTEAGLAARNAGDDGEGAAKLIKFHRESLEHVVVAATGDRPRPNIPMIML